MAAEKTFIAAVEEKYADCDMAVSDSMFVLKNMDVAGSDGKVHVPREMSLHRLGVTCAGDTDRIKEICCQVTSLDVTNNLLTDWKEIFTILACMPRVNFLNLSENALTEPLSDMGDQTFPNVTQLALNSTSIPLTTVEALLEIMPNVSELHLCMNAYTSLTHQHQHPRVTTLYLNANKLNDFSEILKLSPVYPNLRQLLLLQNPFTQLPAPQDIQSTFPNLECLNITETGVTCWTELEKLRHFPALTDIRMKNLPLFKGMEEKLRRQFIISYIPALTKLNMSTVSQEERTTAERRFVRHFVEKDDKPARFAELEVKHGTLNPLVNIDFAPPEQCTIQVHVGDKVVMKSIKLNQTVLELKKTLAREVAGEPSIKFKFFHHTPDRPHGADNLSARMGLALHSLRVEDGDVFILERKFEYDGK